MESVYTILALTIFPTEGRVDEGTVFMKHLVLYRKGMFVLKFCLYCLGSLFYCGVVVYKLFRQILGANFFHEGKHFLLLI